MGLAGDWVSTKQSIRSTAAAGRIAHDFHARDLHLVMGAVAPQTPIRFCVKLDGQTPGQVRGTDVDALGEGRVAEPRMYHLTRQEKPVVDL